MWARHLLSTEAFTLSSNCLHMADFYCSTQLLQFTQPDHLLGGQAIIGTFHFHQLQRNDWLTACLMWRNWKIIHSNRLMKNYFMAVICNTSNTDLHYIWPVGTKWLTRVPKCKNEIWCSNHPQNTARGTGEGRDHIFKAWSSTTLSVIHLQYHSASLYWQQLKIHYVSCFRELISAVQLWFINA